MRRRGSCGFEELANKLDLAADARRVNRQAILTPYRHPKMTPLERSGSWPDAV